MAVAIRTVQILATVILIGTPVFTNTVWRPAVATVRYPAQRYSLREHLIRRLRPLLTLAAYLLAFAAVADVCNLTVELRQLALAEKGFAASVASLVTNTATGNQIAWRVPLAFALLWSKPWLRFSPFRTTIWSVCSLAVLATFSMTSHAAAIANLGPAVAHLVHMTATAIWYGGLSCFLFLPWAELRGDAALVLRETVNRFAQLGLLTMTALGATGLLMANTYLYGVPALLEHRYGMTLLVKLAFVAGVLLLAALNHLWVKPGLQAKNAQPKYRKALRSFVRGEVCLGLVVICVAAVLASSAPPAGEPLRLNVVLTTASPTPVYIESAAYEPIRLTIENKRSVPSGYIIPLARSRTDYDKRPADFQLVVGPGQSKTVQFSAPGPGQYTIYYVAEGQMIPTGLLVIK